MREHTHCARGVAALMALAVSAVLAQSPSQSAAGDHHRSVSIDSREDGEEVRADIHGLIDRPFADMARALSTPEQWCAMLVLHINNKGCRVAAVSPPHLALKVARKYDQPVEQAYDLEFAYRVLASTSSRLSVQLEAPAGPVGTSNYRIRLDAAPHDEAHTALQLSYAYQQASVTGLAMDLYFATVGRGKVGFTIAGHAADGHAEYIGGARGLAERNLMRYFLALEAAAVEPDIRSPGAFGRRLHHWFDATESYPRQLHEVDLPTYLELKRPLEPKGSH